MNAPRIVSLAAKVRKRVGHLRDPSETLNCEFSIAHSTIWNGFRGAGSGEVGEVTRLLGDIRNGDKNAESELLLLVYDELRRLARKRMRQEGAGHTLQTTALVHEAYIRLLGTGNYLAGSLSFLQRDRSNHAPHTG